MGYVTRRGDKNKTKTTTNPQKAVGTENWERQRVGGWVGRKTVIQNCCEKTLRLSSNLLQDKSVAYSLLRACFLMSSSYPSKHQ